MKLSHYAILSKIFNYPDDSYKTFVKEAMCTLTKEYPEASKELEKFLELLPATTSEIQELYTRSFEVQAVTSLEIGYVLYGDDYTRGEVLVHLNQEHKNANNDLGEELSDHLANVLRLIPKMQDNNLMNDLVRLMLAPAIEIMMNEYNVESMKQKDKLYKKQYKTLIVPSFPLGLFLHLFKALYIVLDSDFSLIKENRPFEDASFLGFLKHELEVEEGKHSSNSCGTTFNSCGTNNSDSFKGLNKLN